MSTAGNVPAPSLQAPGIIYPCWGCECSAFSKLLTVAATATATAMDIWLPQNHSVASKTALEVWSSGGTLEGKGRSRPCIRTKVSNRTRDLRTFSQAAFNRMKNIPQINTRNTIANSKHFYLINLYIKLCKRQNSLNCIQT